MPLSPSPGRDPILIYQSMPVIIRGLILSGRNAQYKSAIMVIIRSKILHRFHSSESNTSLFVPFVESLYFELDYMFDRLYYRLSPADVKSICSRIQKDQYKLSPFYAR